MSNQEIKAQFQEWFKKSDSIIKFADGFATQDAQYRNRLKTKKDLFKYFKREFIEQ